jgi:predicted TIM-barrel fold metal-dependent hydrolase
VEKLERLVRAEPRFIALRFHAFRGREPYFENWDDDGLKKLWYKAWELGLAIELHISPDQARGLASILGDMPDCPVMIDHLSESGLGSDTEYEDMLSLARYPNVWIKLSALERIRNGPGGGGRLRNLVQRVAEAFGPRRLVWGGGLPNYLDTLLTSCSVDERSLVKGKKL